MALVTAACSLPFALRDTDTFLQHAAHAAIALPFLALCCGVLIKQPAASDRSSRLAA